MGSYKHWFFYVTNPSIIVAVISVITTALLLYVFEKIEIVPIASLLGIMALGFVIREKSSCALGEKLSGILNTLWPYAKLLLFFFIGAEVDEVKAVDASALGALLILCGLLGRWIGVLIALIKTNLNIKEKIFCLIAYMPKATVQAAIGAVALTMVSQGSITLSNGTATGHLILALAVLSVLITAPLEALGASLFGPRLSYK